MSEEAHGMKATKGGSSFGEFCRRFSRHRMAMLGFTVLMLEVLLPDDRFRRIGQSVAAASLPQVRP